MLPETFVTRPFSVVTARSDADGGLSSLGQFLAMCPGLPHLKHARSDAGTLGLEHSDVACLPPQLPQRTSLSACGSVLEAERLGWGRFGCLVWQRPDRLRRSTAAMSSL